MWVPASDTHAIETVALSFIFSESLPQKFLNNASVFADQLHDDGVFFKKDEIHTAQVQVREGASFVQQPTIVGYSFTSRQNEEELRLQTELAHFVASEYGTWRGFIERANTLLDPFMSSVLTATGVKHVKLEYADRFVFTGEMKDADISGVLDLNSGIGVPNAGIKDGMPWHNRRGWFELIDEGPVLINCNISVGEVAHREKLDAPLRSVQITTVVESRFEQPIEDLDNLHFVLDRLHTTSKSVFGSVVTKNTAERVGL